jgi:hypothetical protein
MGGFRKDNISGDSPFSYLEFDNLLFPYDAFGANPFTQRP